MSELVDYVNDQFCQSYIRIILHVRALNAEIIHSPGCVVRNGDRKQYPKYQYSLHGCQKQKGISESEVEQKLAYIEYLKKLTEERMNCKRQLKKMEKALKALGFKGGELMAAYEAGQRRRKAEEEAKAYYQEEALKKPFAEHYVHATLKGDMVASKMEKLIADTMYKMGIKYEYEAPLYDEFVMKNYYPDFTVIREDGWRFYIEYAGMMDRKEYRERHENKLKAYEKMGIHVGEQLLVALEDGTNHFSLEKFEEILKYYLMKTQWLQ